MPRGDGTGPMGMGAMTGRAAGFCAGYDVPGCVDTMPGRGFGMGRGGFGRGGMGRGGMGRGFGRGYGYGFRNRFWADDMRQPMAMPAPGIEALKEQAEYLTGALENIQKQIADLEGESN